MRKQNSCGELDRLLIAANGRPDRAFSLETQQHVEECERCRMLIKTLNSSERFDLAPELIHRLQSPILGTLKPVRPLPPIWAFLLLFLVIFVVFAAFGVHRLGPFGWAVLSGFQKSVIFTSLAASAALLGFSTVRQMQPGSKSLLSPSLLPIAVFVFLSIAVAGVFQYENDPHFVRAGIGCLQAGIPYAIPSGLFFWLVLSRGVVLHPYVAGATAGMLAGLIGTSVLEVHCPILDMWHILVWHLGVCAAGSVAGLLAAYLGQIISRAYRYR